MNLKVCIYRHIRLDKNEVFYIGIGNLKRPYSTYKRNKFWKNIVTKTNYEVQVLKSDLTWEDAKELEIMLIAFYGRRDLNLGNLVNLTDGGEGTKGRKYVPTELHKLNLSKSQIGKKLSIETKLKISLSQKGRIISKINLEKLRLSNIGRIKSDIEKFKISQNNKNSKPVICLITGNSWKSAIECAKSNNINYNMLKRKLAGNRTNNTPYKYIINE